MHPNAQPPTPLADTPECVQVAAAKELEDFIYLISHDVRNSVRALIELPQWIVEDLGEAGVRIDGSVAETIELMNRHTGRLDRMLVDLLAFSRVGRMQQARDIAIDEALTEVLEEIRVPTGFKIMSAIDSNSIHMGEQDILTMLTALLSNAIKHHDQPTGKVVVAVFEQEGGTCFRVSDDGPGIPEKFHKRIFEPMTTLRPRDEVEGSGMGLAVVRKIAQLYGGDASVISSCDAAGTSIEVVIPKLRH